MTVEAPPRLVNLATRLRDAKAIEAKATRDRVEIEREIIALVRFTKAEGQETYAATAGELSRASVVLRQPVSTKFDEKTWVEKSQELGEKLYVRVASALRTKLSLDTKAARDLQDRDKEAWLALSEFVTRKPGKVAVDVKEAIVDVNDAAEVMAMAGEGES